MATNVYKAIIRSLTPWATSVAAAVIAHFGFHVSAIVSAQIVVYAGTVLTVLLHALETRYRWVGVFLGWIGAPVYEPGAKASMQATIASLQAELAAISAKLPVTAPESPVTPATDSPVSPSAVADLSPHTTTVTTVS